jgi:L-seryl-tRNA(Ser) seleniumtransferase
MIAAEEQELKARAAAWQKHIGQGEVQPSRSTVGGGSLPEETLPTWVLSISVEKPNRVARRLRDLEPPVIARIEEDKLLLDPRTVLPDQDLLVMELLASVLTSKG